MNIRIHQILQGSRANGPGTRNVVWFQGCTLNCPGCFNPQTHDPKGGSLLSVRKICSELLDPNRPCDGITISGGEPFLQPSGLLALLKELHRQFSPPILVFSGYNSERLNNLREFSECLDYIDALICGPFIQNIPPDHSRFLSSGNQELLLFSDRFKPADFADLPSCEMIIDPDGTAYISGMLR